MKKYLLFIAILYGNFAFGQLNEAFNDDDFTSAPVWSGSNSGNDFSIIAKQLRSNSLSAAEYYLSTPSTLANNCQWEFWINLQFNPSNLNYVDIYLISDQTNLLSANINGYFIRLGNTEDEICLYKRSGATSTKIIDGDDGVLNKTNNKLKIRVTRTDNNFTLEYDVTGLGTSYVSKPAIYDASHTTTANFGIYIKQSSAGSVVQKHFFDDFQINSIITDTTPPKLSTATVIDSTTLEITFDEPVDSVTAKNLLNYTINNSIGNPISITKTTDTKYILKLSSGLNTATYTITTSGIKDIAGNLIATTNNTASFSYIKPFVAKKGDLVINEIFADPSPQIDLPSVEFIEIYNTTNQTIQLKNWKHADQTSTANFPIDSIKMNEYLILCAKADTNEYKSLGKTIGLSPWPSLNNSSDNLKLISPENKTIDSVAYSDTWYPTEKKQGGWTLEKINYKSVCTGLFSWMASSDPTGGTPGKQNSIFIPNYDALAFEADSMSQLSDTTLTIYFNKPADQTTASNAFNLNPVADIKSTTFSANAKQATLTFSSSFSANTLYQLSVSQLKDCSQNSITSRSFQFTTPALPPTPPVRLDTAKVYITEIFADPSPEIQLPLAEFVEIYNPGKDTIDLGGWILSDPVTNATIANRKIFPEEYVILCQAADTLQYQSSGKVIGLAQWPSLNNSSDKIYLKSFKDRLVDSVFYMDTWHTSLDKKQGGWSLERIDHQSVCDGLFNWASSTHSSGGTPGKPNSVQIRNYDQLAFKADSLEQPSDSTLIVYLNKHTDISTATNAFNLQPSAGNIKSVVFNTRAEQATLTFSSKFAANTFYELNIAQLKDCSGNTTNATLNFTTPKLPPVRLDTAEIFITEIFADPSPEVKLPLTEFVEIFNPGKDTIDLDGWVFSNSKSKTSFKQISILPGEFMILCPLSDTSFYAPSGKVYGFSSWLSLTNTSDKVTLKSFKNRLVDSVTYSDSWHTTTKKQGGWSLERIDYQSVCDGLCNWSSSIDASGGTPGKQNSVQILNYDKIAFKADSIKQSSDSTINIFFNKHVDISTATNAFELHPIAGSVKSVAFDIDALKATLLFSDKLAANTRYELAISQLRDCAGNEITSPTILNFTTPKLPPVRLDTAKLYITEIFADPSPEVKLPLVEFVEIYNQGKDTINLDGWTLHTSTGKSVFKNASILPNGYLILCPATDTIQYQPYGRTAGFAPWPTLTNSSAQVYLKSFKGRLVDSVSYSDSWHNPTKKQGGWSLERIDYLSACSGAFNWLSSTDITGGTPGKQNSIYIRDYDKLAFRVDSIQHVSDTLINVFFNKPTDISTATNAFNLTPGSVKSAGFNTQFTKATLLCDKFEANTRHQLTVTKIKDCAGNEIMPNPALTFTTPKLPPARLDTANLYITEIFADPSPEVKLPLVEFIEIFNPGKDTILLEGWTLNTANSKGTLKAGSILPQGYLILSATADTSQYRSYGKIAGISPWPALTNVSGQIILKSFKGRTVDSVAYKDAWYKDDLKKTGGWSLELIDKLSICNTSQNWIASNDPSGGTPGRQNSVHQLYNSQPLKLTSASLVDSLSISLTFNRPPDSLSAANLTNYSINNGLGKPSYVQIAPATSHIVELKFTKPINRGKTYRIEISNVTDCSGKAIAVSNNSAEFFYPEKIKNGDILISEVLFNPREGSVDFVEIYNNSDHELDLKELSIANIKAPDSIVNRKIIATNTFLFKSKQYLVLSTDPDNVKKEYHTENPDAFLRMASMPALNNDAGSVVLLSNDDRIDQFSYHEKMHFALIKDAKGISLERSDFSRPANDNGNFRSAAASIGYGTPGYKNSQVVDNSLPEANEIALLSKTFSPDNDGFEDALQINYNFKEAGMVTNATIYNDKGILIKRLVKNTTLAANGTLVWDGMNDNEQISPVGVYIVYVEAFNLSGELRKYRKAFVLAAKLN